MNYYIQQSIHIQLIKIGSIENSSILQIGSAGLIKPTSHLYNPDGFTEPASQMSPSGVINIENNIVVPLQPPKITNKISTV